jgi:hypothetical protein
MRRPSANWNVVRAELPKSFEPTMSGMGQTEKSSVRAYVFRFALELGHCSMPSACLKGANIGLMHRSNRPSYSITLPAQRRSNLCILQL